MKPHVVESMRLRHSLLTRHASQFLGSLQLGEYLAAPSATDGGGRGKYLGISPPSRRSFLRCSLGLYSAAPARLAPATCARSARWLPAA